MNKRLTLIIGALLLLFHAPSTSTAQSGFDLQKGIENLQQRLSAERDPLQETIKKVDQMKNEFHDQKYDVDAETAQIVRNLRNPFIPQLPNDAELPTDTPEVSPGDNRRPVRSDPRQTQRPEPQLPPPSFTLSGLVWNTERPQAIIDGEVRDVGDRIDAWDIIEITREGVILRRGEETYTLESTKP